MIFLLLILMFLVSFSPYADSLFMFPLLVCTLLMFTLYVHTSSLLLYLFLLPNTFCFFQKLSFLSLFYFCKTFIHVSSWYPFSLPFVISFCETPSLFLVLFGFVFFFFACSNLVHLFLFLNFVQVFWRNLKNCSFTIFFIFICSIFLSVWENVFLLSFVLKKHPFFFFWAEWCKTKIKFFQISSLAISYVFKRFFF